MSDLPTERAAKEFATMDISPKRKLALLMLGVTGMTGVGLAASGVASAQSSTPQAPATAEPTVPEGSEAPTAAEAPGEPSDAALTASGITPHADAVGQSVDHQFEGVE